ncbi:hypothetical protein INR49_009797, partial [Caranx melampygus]
MDDPPLLSLPVVPLRPCLPVCSRSVPETLFHGASQPQCLFPSHTHLNLQLQISFQLVCLNLKPSRLHPESTALTLEETPSYSDSQGPSPLFS